MNRAQQETIDEKATMLGVQADDVTILDDTPDRVDVVIGIAKGRPRQLVVNDAGEVLAYRPVPTPKALF